MKKEIGNSGYFILNDGTICNSHNFVVIPKTDRYIPELILPIKICGINNVAMLIAVTYGLIPGDLTELPDNMELRRLDGNPFNCAPKNLVYTEIDDNSENWCRFRDTQYFVSTKGRIISEEYPKKFKKLTKQGINKNYLTTRLAIHNKDGSTVYKLMPVARIVAETFLDFIPNNGNVIHRNGNCLDNSVENLEITDCIAGNAKKVRFENQLYRTADNFCAEMSAKYGGSFYSWRDHVNKFNRGIRTSKTKFLKDGGFMYV